MDDYSDASDGNMTFATFVNAVIESMMRTVRAARMGTDSVGVIVMPDASGYTAQPARMPEVFFVNSARVGPCLRKSGAARAVCDVVAAKIEARARAKQRTFLVVTARGCELFGDQTGPKHAN